MSSEMSHLSSSVLAKWLSLASILLLIVCQGVGQAQLQSPLQQQQQQAADRLAVALASSRPEDNSIAANRHVNCGSMAANQTSVILKNPHHPLPTYTKTICETVIERASPSISRLNIKLNQLELFRPTMDGECLHDRFAVYTDLNAAMSPILCGNQTGNSILVPVTSKQTHFVVSILTSNLDHDRMWSVQVTQE